MKVAPIVTPQTILPPLDGRELVDELHSTGRCTCAGEGRCPWCLAPCPHGQPFRIEDCFPCTDAALLESYAETARLRARVMELEELVSSQREAGRRMLRVLKSAQRSRDRALERAQDFERQVVLYASVGAALKGLEKLMDVGLAVASERARCEAACLGVAREKAKFGALAQAGAVWCAEAIRDLSRSPASKI